jgi:hypothetical protein
VGFIVVAVVGCGLRLMAVGGGDDGHRHGFDVKNAQITLSFSYHVFTSDDQDAHRTHSLHPTTLHTGNLRATSVDGFGPASGSYSDFIGPNGVGTFGKQ